MHQQSARASKSRLRYNLVDVEASINSGQVFLWQRNEDMWYGVDGSHVVAVNNNGKSIRSHVGNPPDIFRKDDNMKKILGNICRDKQVALAVKRFEGMRLMRQDPFQCLITFITSANSSIPNIKNALCKLCAKYGETASLDGIEFSLFPSPEKLARASIKGLCSCSLGYRAKYVKEAARYVHTGKLDLDSLADTPYKEAVESLLSVAGVGRKVADCVLLFSLEKLEAFPLDRWMARILQEIYKDEDFGRMTGITPKRYDAMHEMVVERFGPFAGYAQQFLFKMGRQNANGAWAVNP